MAVKAYYASPVADFLGEDHQHILGILTIEHHHALEDQQRWAWLQQISILRTALSCQQEGYLFLEFYIPRMGKRVDALLILENIVFVVEFKVGAREHHASALDQVEDYALDLKNFHEGSHEAPIVPVLVSTDSTSIPSVQIVFSRDLVAPPIGVNSADLGRLLNNICSTYKFPLFNIAEWMATGYRPTPTIIQAAEVLYRTHSVTDISRSDAGAINLDQTSSRVCEIMDWARLTKSKAICFVTGVPGSGKTLAGLNIATKRSELHVDEHAVFLSGNGPLVDVLREALARDKAAREDIPKSRARREVSSFIQNIHHFRDDFVGNNDVPSEKVVVFDEAQRAWSREKASYFMQRKRGHANFDMSEPHFLIGVMDRHLDWCTVVCLIGGRSGNKHWRSWYFGVDQRPRNILPALERLCISTHRSARVRLPTTGCATSRLAARSR
jgi:hypothetical protein